jgi:hypothetical protein
VAGVGAVRVLVDGPHGVARRVPPARRDAPAAGAQVGHHPPVRHVRFGHHVEQVHEDLVAGAHGALDDVEEPVEPPGGDVRHAEPARVARVRRHAEAEVGDALRPVLAELRRGDPAVEDRLDTPCRWTARR